MHHVGGVLSILRDQVGEATTDGSSNILVRRTLNRNLSHWGWSRGCSVLHGTFNNLVARGPQLKQEKGMLPIEVDAVVFHVPGLRVG